MQCSSVLRKFFLQKGVSKVGRGQGMHTCTCPQTCTLPNVHVRRVEILQKKLLQYSKFAKFVKVFVMLVHY